MNTKHYEVDRLSRRELIEKIGVGKVVNRFKWDRHHPNGPEFHDITNTGLILISNCRTKKHITTLIARPGQIRRYYNAVGKEAPKELVDIAYKHLSLGYNNM